VITQVPPKVPNTPGYLYLPAWQFKFIGKTAFAENVHKQIGRIIVALDGANASQEK
jgi:hypothetical protein